MSFFTKMFISAFISLGLFHYTVPTHPGHILRTSVATVKGTGGPATGVSSFNSSTGTKMYDFSSATVTGQAIYSCTVGSVVQLCGSADGKVTQTITNGNDKTISINAYNNLDPDVVVGELVCGESCTNGKNTITFSSCAKEAAGC